MLLLLVLPLASAAPVDAPLAPEAAALALWERVAAGASPAEWLDATAWRALRHRDTIRRIGGGQPETDAMRKLRLVGSGTSDFDDIYAAVSSQVKQAPACRVGTGARTWTVSPHAAPEVEAFWPRREEVVELALVPLACDRPVGLAALGLVRSSTWRVAAVLPTPDDPAWMAFAEEATQDVPARRVLEAEQLRGAFGAPTWEGWAPPKPARVRRTWGDVDGDGAEDVLVGGVLFRGRDRSLTKVRSSAVVREVGDVDGDGRSELLVLTAESPVVWLGGDPTRTWAPPGGTTPATEWLAADLDGDGRYDLVALRGAEARAWLGGPSGTSARLSLPAPPTHVARAGDLDGDGMEDLVFGYAAYGDGRGALQVVFGGAAPPRTTVIIGGHGERLGKVYASGDIDQDGAPELIVPVAEPLRQAQRIAAYGLDGHPRTLMRFMVKDGCHGAWVRDLDPGPGAEVVAHCGARLHVWAGGTVRDFSMAGGLSVGPRTVVLDGTPTLPVLGRYDLRFVRGPDWSFEDAAPYRLPGLPDPNVPRVVHWSEVQQKVRVNPKATLPDGVDEARCTVRVAIDAQGVPTEVTAKSCQAEVFAGVREAVMASRWYPVKGPGGPGPALFDVTYNLRR